MIFESMRLFRENGITHYGSIDCFGMSSIFLEPNLQRFAELEEAKHDHKFGVTVARRGIYTDLYEQAAKKTPQCLNILDLDKYCRRRAVTDIKEHLMLGEFARNQRRRNIPTTIVTMSIPVLGKIFNSNQPEPFIPILYLLPSYQ